MANNKRYWCTDCEITFYVGTEKRYPKNIHCPFCGDYASVEHKVKQEKWWTEREKNILQQMTAEGHTLMQIAAKLGRSYESVNGMKSRMQDVPSSMPPRWTDQEIATLQKMMMEGKALSEIMEALGRSYSQIYNKIKRMKKVNKPE